MPSQAAITSSIAVQTYPKRLGSWSSRTLRLLKLVSLEDTKYASSMVQIPCSVSYSTFFSLVAGATVRSALCPDIPATARMAP